MWRFVKCCGTVCFAWHRRLWVNFPFGSISTGAFLSKSAIIRKSSACGGIGSTIISQYRVDQFRFLISPQSEVGNQSIMSSASRSHLTLSSFHHITILNFQKVDPALQAYGAHPRGAHLGALVGHQDAQVRRVARRALLLRSDRKTYWLS